MNKHSLFSVCSQIFIYKINKDYSCCKEKLHRDFEFSSFIFPEILKRSILRKCTQFCRRIYHLFFSKILHLRIRERCLWSLLKNCNNKKGKKKRIVQKDTSKFPLTRIWISFLSMCFFSRFTRNILKHK